MYAGRGMWKNHVSRVRMMLKERNLKKNHDPRYHDSLEFNHHILDEGKIIIIKECIWKKNHL